MNRDEQKRTDAREMGLLTIREWFAKYKMADAANLTDAFTLDGGRGFVRDEPAQLLINTDGTFFVHCGGLAVLRLPGPIEVSRRANDTRYVWARNGAFYLTLNTDGPQPRLEFAEAC